jgi:cysteine desulfurase
LLRPLDPPIEKAHPQRVIYLDSNATTQIDPTVVESMLPFLHDYWENPSSPTRGGRKVHQAIETARGHVASLLNAEADEVHFNSGATEGCNAVIRSAQLARPDRPRLIVSATEHPAVLEPARRWQSRGGLLSIVPVHSEGVPDLAALSEILTQGDTALVSIMLANNETGVLAPLAEVTRLAHESGAWAHSDAVQAIGKMRVDVQSLGLDFLTLSGHKFHAPKGVGALFIRRHTRFIPSILGGGQENGRRSGTENVASIIGLGTAAEIAAHREPTSVTHLRDAFESQLLSRIPDARVHGGSAPRLGNTSSVYLPEADAAGMLILLDEKGIACSAGSACHSAALHPSHVLEAMGVGMEEAKRTLRFSFSRFNTLAQVTEAVDQVCRQAEKLKSLSPAESGPVVISSST